MTAILRMLARSGIVIGNPFHQKRHYIRPRPGDGARDFAKIAGDMRAVDQNLRRVLARNMDTHGKSPDAR